MSKILFNLIFQIPFLQIPEVDLPSNPYAAIKRFYMTKRGLKAFGP